MNARKTEEEEDEKIQIQQEEVKSQQLQPLWSFKLIRKQLIFEFIYRSWKLLTKKFKSKK